MVPTSGRSVDCTIDEGRPLGCTIDDGSPSVDPMAEGSATDDKTPDETINGISIDPVVADATEEG